MELQPVFKVSEFNEMIHHHLASLGEVVVEGELSELKVSRGKWIYATIKDEEASLNVFGTVFQIKNLNVLEVGMQVKVVGQPSLYQKTARFSLNAWEILPSGEGALKAAYEKLKKQLEAEGLFAPERKRPLPQFPEKIGLITAKGSQAYNDFIKVTQARIGGLKIYFYPVAVQGKEAVKEVKEALSFFNETKKVEVIVVTRGGGSLEDLAAFNDESVTRAVFASQIPVVCAIGHEGDVSLAELAADLRASTPSNAAELVVKDRREVVKEIEFLKDKLKDRYLFQLMKWEQRVNEAIRTMKLSLETSLKEIDEVLIKFESLKTKIEEKIRVYQVQIEQMVKRLRGLNPTRLLKRGFSLIKDDQGRLLTSAEQAKLNQNLLAIMSDGYLTTKVIKKGK